MRKRLENGVSVEEGALTQIHLASSNECCGVSGEHWMECSVISQGFSKLRYIMAAHHLRASVGPRLWEHTEKMLEPKLQQRILDADVKRIAQTACLQTAK